MTLHVPHTLADDRESTWRAIDHLLDEFARRGRLVTDEGALRALLLECAIRAVSGSGGAIWRIADGRPAVRLEELNYAAASDPTELTRSLMIVGQTGLAHCHEPPRTSAPAADVPRLLAAVQAEPEAVDVLEILADPQAPATALTAALDVAAEFAAAAKECRASLLLAESHSRREEYSRFAELVRGVHRTLDATATAYAIAHEGRRFMECDRVWFAEARGATHAVVAASGSTAVERKSPTVRALEALMDVVAQGGEALWYDGSSAEFPPVVESALHNYLEHSPARQLAVIPLRDAEESNTRGSSSAPIGVVTMESFAAAENEATFRRRGAVLGEQAECAWRHAWELRSLPGAALARVVARAAWYAKARRAPTWLKALTIVGLTVAVLCVVPGDFTVEAHGALQPRQRRDIFSPRDAIVEGVLVDHGANVAPGLPLIQLQDPNLDYELARVTGESQTTAQQMRSLRARRVGSPTSTASAEGAADLAAEEDLLTNHLQNLDAQRALLQSQREALLIRTPIAGQVMTWKAGEHLSGRPVRQGERLLQVADVHGPWVLELRVSDANIRHVLEAQRELEAELAVSFLLATDLETRYAGRIESIALTAEGQANESPTVRVTVALDEAAATALKPGTSVVARIQCGRRSLGYIWTRDLIDTLRQKLFY